MRDCPQHTFRDSYQTKCLTPGTKPNGLDAQHLDRHYPENATVTRQKWLTCKPGQQQSAFCEPLLTPMDNLPLEGIDWVIVGGESGPGARPMRLEWVLSILAPINRPKYRSFSNSGAVPGRTEPDVNSARIYDAMPSPLARR